MSKLTRRQSTAIGLLHSIQSVAEMRIPGDERDAIARLAIIEIDVARAIKLLTMTKAEGRTALANGEGK